jgi:SNF2 family DNA or RNA helicase
MPNGFLNLFGQIFTLDLGKSLGRYITYYKREHFYQTGYGGYTWLLQDGHDKVIQKKLKPLVIRFDEEVLDLPKKVTVPTYLTLNKKCMQQYKQFEKEFVMQVEHELVTAANAAVLTQKLRQVANGGIYTDEGTQHLHYEKADAVVDLMEELGGKPLLVGYEFNHDADRLCEKLGDIPVIGGGMKPKTRAKVFKEFNEGQHEVIAGQIEAMALGLNLQHACHHVCIHSLPWDLESYIQFIRRVYRSGQRYRTYVHHLIARNTIDEVIMKVLRRKDKTQTALLNTLKTQLRRRR